MSLNIQTSNGLLEIGGSVTKDKVTSALGYLPANEEVESVVDDHISDHDIHITAAERAKWNSNSGGGSSTSDFSGDYNDLINKPNVNDDGSGEFVIQDRDENVVLAVNADGIRTTNVNMQELILKNVSINKTETWTFTLEDGSTVTKVVCVG